MPATEKKTAALARELEQAARTVRSAEELMRVIVTRLNQAMLRYNWAGFYMIERKPGTEPMLVLGPFVGEMTPHTRIKLNEGLCGAAASTGKTVVVDDVNSDPRYLACSVETRSEIVAPIFVHGKVVGELDIDSRFSAAFASEDRELVEHCAALVGQFLERRPA